MCVRTLVTVTTGAAASRGMTPAVARLVVRSAASARSCWNLVLAVWLLIMVVILLEESSFV